MSQQSKAAGDFTGDQHWGKGGRYVIDITNGQRIPVPNKGPETAATDEAAAVVATEEVTDAGKAKSVKENKRA